MEFLLGIPIRFCGALAEPWSQIAAHPKEHGGRGEGGVSTQGHLVGRGEPAQSKLFAILETLALFLI